MKLIKKLGDRSEEYKPLKKAYTECQKHISDLKHIQDFKELPDDKKLTQEHFDKYMAQVPQSTNHVFPHIVVWGFCF